jgi:hypothetical protein
MNVHLSQRAIEALATAPLTVQKAFIKQISFLVRNLNHPRSMRRSSTKPKAAGKPASMTTGVFSTRIECRSHGKKSPAMQR